MPFRSKKEISELLREVGVPVKKILKLIKNKIPIVENLSEELEKQPASCCCILEL